MIQPFRWFRHCIGAARRLVAGAEFREVLLYCLPALLVGIALRCALTIHMPWGFLQYDSAEYLETPFRLLKSHTLHIDGKRGFLVPILYSIPFLLHIPALIMIPLGQHLLGLAATILSGALTRLWFRWWRLFIVPVTLYVAANPSMLWYEQTLMGESEFLFALIFLALAGTLWARKQTRCRFALLLAALVCATGARPEGRLFLAFGLLLAALIHWGQWRSLAKSVAAMLAISVAGALIVRQQSTAPQLLYATLIQLSPDTSRLVPGVEPYIIPLRDRVRAQSGGDLLQLVKVSKDIRDYLDPYLWTQVRSKRTYYKALDRTIRDLCIEAIINHPLQALEIPWRKFRTAVDSWSGYRFDEAALHKDQLDSWFAEKDKRMYKALVKGLTGQALDTAAVRDFVQTHYRPEKVAWLGHFQEQWNNAIIRCRTADRPWPQKRWVHDYLGGVPGGLRVMPGLPWLYPLAALGMLMAMIWPAPDRRLHIAWVPVMLAVWYAAMFVGVTNARYRFAYEPFCFIYACLLADFAFRFWCTRQESNLKPSDP